MATTPSPRSVEAVEPSDRNGNGRPPKRGWRGRRDWAGLFARLLCAAFALIGVVPLLLAGLARIDAVQRWAAQETTAFIDKEFGVDAHYDLELQPWPLQVTLSNVLVAADDGGTPFLEAERIVARPRVFSLLAGKQEIGEVTVDEPRLRAVIKNGELVNLDYRAPESEGETGRQDPPLSSLSLTNAKIDLTVDDLRVRANAIDLDVTDEDGPFEVSLRSEVARIDHLRRSGGAPQTKPAARAALDEDILCQLDMRARVDGKDVLAGDINDVLLRRLSVYGAVDFDPAAGTRPSCHVVKTDWRRADLRLEQLRVRLANGGLTSAGGRIDLRVPAALANRFAEIAPVTGWIDVELDAHYNAGSDLPSLSGAFRGADLGVEGKIISRRIAGKIETLGDKIVLRDMTLAWAGGEGSIGNVQLRPFAKGIPVKASDIVLDNVQFPELLSDLGAHPRAHVAWTLARTTVATFSGTVDPPQLSGPMTVDTHGFAVHDRPTDAYGKRTMMAIARGGISGTFMVTPSGVVMQGFHIITPNSHVIADVSLGFDEVLGITIHDGSKVDLSDISPIADIPMEGVVSLTAEGHGVFSKPLIDGKMSVDDFKIGGFPLGNITRTDVEFEPLSLTLSNAQLAHGSSRIEIPRLVVDFDAGGIHEGANVVIQGQLDSSNTGLLVSDFYEMVNLHDDPRFGDIDGWAKGLADVYYVLGGPLDSCGGGRLQVRTQMELADVDLWGEQYETGSIDLDFLWDDQAAGDRGMDIDIHSAVLNKSSGVILARASISRGAKLRVDATGAAIPLNSLSAYAPLFEKATEEAQEELAMGSERGTALAPVIKPEGTMSFVAAIGGTLSKLEGEAEVEISPLRLGPALLPESKLRLTIVPKQDPPLPEGVPLPTPVFTGCEQVVGKPFSQEEYDRDESSGVFRLGGSLFGGQVTFDDVEITQQRRRWVSGSLKLIGLDLGALANLQEGVAFSASPPAGRLSAEVHIDELELDEPGLAEVRVFIKGAELTRAGDQAVVGEVLEPIVLSGNVLRVPTINVRGTLAKKFSATLEARGEITRLTSEQPEVDISVDLPETDLSRLGFEIPQIERAAGTVSASLHVRGPLAKPRIGGNISLERGELRLKGLPLPLSEIDVDVEVGSNEVVLRRANARAGNTGFLALNGRVRLDGFSMAGASATLIARGVQIPVADGIRLTANGTLNATYTPDENDPGVRPSVTGTVGLTNFAYTRPIVFRYGIDLDQIGKRQKSEVDTYNPDKALFNFDIKIVSPRPLRIANNLIDVRLDVTPAGLRLVGNDQRFGASGKLRFERGGKLFLLGHHFTVKDGTVDFEDLARIAPRLDVNATTEYRRYATSSDLEPAAGVDAAAASTGGKWSINLHAYGDTDEPKVRFSSDPPLTQEDILLLLQVGMTRAELDRGLFGDLFTSVGLDALSAVSGFDQAVRKTVPLIDEFRISSVYSSRTGRPEPAATVGKRITENVRATLTTGLTENNEVRTNIEWKLGKGVSVQGSYDNVDDSGSSAIGNIGLDLRWRKEFD